MKTPRIVSAMDYLDSDIISEATEKPKRRKLPFARIGALAACLALALVASITTYIFTSNTNDPVSSSVNDTDIVDTPGNGEKPSNIDIANRPYKDVIYSTSDEIAYIPRWDERDLAEQYSSITVNGKRYSRLSTIPHRQEVIPQNVGTSLGFFEASGYDVYEDTVHHSNFEVFEISGVNASNLIAVKIEGTYYAYITDYEAAPYTLGELISIYSLDDYLELNRYSYYVNRKSQGYFALEDDSYIWQVLSECGEAVSVDSNELSLKNCTYLQFTATSNTLGFYKKVFTVTSDGYVQTNAFNYSYVYKIGKEAAQKIFDYASQNKKEAERTPYYYYLIGTVTEVGEDYILVNDSVLCKNPEDGITFKILLSTKRLKREACSVGTTVVVEMLYDLTSIKESYTIDFAVGIQRCYITEHGAIVNE